MRKIEEAMIEAVRERQPWKQANTQVTVAHSLTSKIIRVYLHRNLICDLTVYDGWFVVRFDHCGWLTNTTKSRLNALAQHLGFDPIRQIDGEWYWAGDKTRPFDHRKDWMRVTAKALPEEVAA